MNFLRISLAVHIAGIPSTNATTSDRKALLRVDRPPIVAAAGAQEHVLELVHAGVGEQQSRITGRHNTRRRHKRMAVLLHEEMNELLANLVGGPHSGHSID